MLCWTCQYSRESCQYIIRGLPTGPKFEHFCTGKWESPAKHLRVCKSGWNKQEQCIVWIPLQCGVPDAKRANSYSAAMIMTCKTGDMLCWTCQYSRESCQYIIRGITTGSKFEYFRTGKWESPAKHLRVCKSGWNEQEQYIVWIPLQCGVPDTREPIATQLQWSWPVRLGKVLAMAHPRKWTPISDATEFNDSSCSSLEWSLSIHPEYMQCT